MNIYLFLFFVKFLLLKICLMYVLVGVEKWKRWFVNNVGVVKISK